ncbi:hypothetical protein ACFUOZ_20100 [Paenarthrobacter sp. NPDC057355]|uniref:hypothetical protein n=1 Tax=Paenarthrobacter sp. NPDC057355 TaxID=3346105 RepID=UPI00363C41DB
MSRFQETSKKHVKAAVPKGSMRAAHGLYQALPALQQDARLAVHTKPFQRRLLAFFEKLISMANYDTMTVRVPWGGRDKAYGEADARPGLVEWLGISRRTVANYFTFLEKWGYIGTVASGRSAEKVREKTAEGNELPVYVICIPSALKGVPDLPSGLTVEEICTPTAPSGVVQLHMNDLLTHTREEKPQEGRGSATHPISGAASGALATTEDLRSGVYWDPHKTTKRRGQRWAAAEEIRAHCFALRPLSKKDLASVLRPWLVSGWTVSDVLNAFNKKPDGTDWPHDGIPVTKHTQRLRGWVLHHLEAWTVDGEPMRSPDARKAEQHAEILRRHAAEQRRILEQQAEHAARIAEGPSPMEIRAKAQLRALFANNRRHRFATT